MGKTRYSTGRLDADAKSENLHLSTTHKKTAVKIAKLNSQAKRIASRGQNFKPALKKANKAFDRSYNGVKGSGKRAAREYKEAVAMSKAFDPRSWGM